MKCGGGAGGRRRDGVKVGGEVEEEEGVEVMEDERVWGGDTDGTDDCGDENAIELNSVVLL